MADLQDMVTGESKSDDGYRCVRTYCDGSRKVIQYHGDGEAWTIYYIVPRQNLIQAIHERRANGKQYHDCEWWWLLPDNAVGYEHYSGPGRSFAHAPHMWKRNRRWVVFYQRGGLDV
jgi:hypothetical protein